MFNEKIPDLKLLCPYMKVGSGCNSQPQQLNRQFSHSEKLKLNIQTLKLIKNDTIEQILLQYNSIKKCLSENLLTEPIFNTFTYKYNIKQQIRTGFTKSYDGSFSDTGEPEYDIMFLHFNYINYRKQVPKNIIKILNIFLELIIFMRPDVEEIINHKNL